MYSLEKLKICVIGLGYVGLPLAVEFSKKFPVIGFDINPKRVEELKNGEDITKEVELNSQENPNLLFTDDQSFLRGCNCYIITVPTPVDKHKQPDLRPLISASEIVGKLIKMFYIKYKKDKFDKYDKKMFVKDRDDKKDVMKHYYYIPIQDLKKIEIKDNNINDNYVVEFD